MFRLLLSWLMCAAFGLASAQTAPVQAAVSQPGSITVVVDANYPPYSFRDAQGQLQGIIKDTWSLWEARTGIAVNLQGMDWVDAQKQIQTGHADVIDAVLKTPAREKLYDFSAPYQRIEVALFFRHGLSGIVDAASVRGVTVGVKDGGSCVDILQSQGVQSLKRYPSYLAVVGAAKAGEISVFCTSSPPATYLLNQMGVADSFRRSAPISVGEFHRAVRKGNVALLTVLESGFARIGADERQRIDEKWLGASVAGADYASLGPYAKYVALSAALFAVLLVSWNLTLRAKVWEKTHSLTNTVAELEQMRFDLEHVLHEQTAMLDNHMVGIIKVIDGVVVWANAAFESMLGIGQGQLVGMPTRSSYASDETYSRISREARPVLAAGQVYRTQAELVRCDGSRFWVELSGSMLAAPKGASLWIFVDVTAHRRAEDERSVALNRLQKLANSVPGMVYQFLQRPDGGFSMPFVSDAVLDIYRVSAQEAQADVNVLIAKHHPADQQQVLDSILYSARHLTPWQQEYRIRHEDGTVRWVYGDSLPERLADGAIQWHGFITDITERKAADERLRQLSRSVEQAPVSIVITDLSGSILYVNPSFTQNTGYTLDEAVGQNPRILKSGLTPPQTYEVLWDTISRGRVWEGEMHNRKKNGDVFIEHAVIAPVLDAQGHTSHYVAIKEEITQRKQTELALQASLKEKVALLHEVHHRVKNNLQIITSLLRLEAGRTDQPATRTVLKDMQGRIYTMALLHESLYRAGTFASVELGSYLKQLATQAFRSQSGLVSDVRLVLDMAEVYVGMDQATPCGLLVNELLSNSLKHGFVQGQAGQVTVGLQPSERTGWWCLSVRDNGVGLPADFESRRALSLGLQLVSDLARQLGGQLTINSASGATFSVTFRVQVFPQPD